MSSIEKSTDQLIASVKNGSAYKRYKKCEKALKKYPGLPEKMNQLRGDIYHLYDRSESDQLLEDTEELQRMYQEMHKIPEVNAYLEAETELCLLVRGVYRRLVGEVGIEPPEM